MLVKLRKTKNENKKHTHTHTNIASSILECFLSVPLTCDWVVDRAAGGVDDDRSGDFLHFRRRDIAQVAQRACAPITAVVVEYFGRLSGGNRAT